MIKKKKKLNKQNQSKKNPKKKNNNNMTLNHSFSKDSLLINNKKPLSAHKLTNKNESKEKISKEKTNKEELNKIFYSINFHCIFIIFSYFF